MSNYRLQQVTGLHDFSTGALVGFLGADGREYLLPASAAYAANAQAGSAYPGNFTTVAATGAVTANGANVNHSLAPSGTGNVTVGPSGTGSATLQRIGAASVLSTDISGTPGNGTVNTLSGKAAFAAAGTTVVVTNSTVTATSKVFAMLQANDTTLTAIKSIVPAAGSFTVTGNAAATAATAFAFLVIN